ncbi:response regulator transcription factor [Paenibacillus planticolens]|nr:helix-turn-helix domain-containing protein [Paenibacillus planticolens]
MMIVDDEPLVRLALHQMIPWHDFNIQIVCEANDGAEAISFLRGHGDIDMVITDIKMPKMSGIDLLRECNASEICKPPVWIILSAYSDYEIVRHTFLLGALDYIVKTELDEEHLIRVVTKAIQTLNQLKTTQRISRVETNEWGRTNTEQYISKLIPINPEVEKFEYDQLTAQICESIGEVNQVAAVLCIKRQPEPWMSDAKKGSFVAQTIQTVLHSMSIPFLYDRQDADNYVLFLTLPEERSWSASRHKIQFAFQLMKTRIEQYMNMKVSIGVSDTANSRKDWRRLYDQAKQLAAKIYFEGFGRIFYPEHAHVEQDSSKHTAKKEEIKRMIVDFIRFFSLEDKLAWEHKLEQIMKTIVRNKGTDPLVTKEVLADFIWGIGAFLYQKGLRWDELDGKTSYPFEAIENSQTLEDTLIWLRQICHSIYSATHESRNMRDEPNSLPVLKAKHLVDSHYRENINLSFICDMVGVSESYLSKQFAKEVGCTFVQYVTNHRMEESKRLLRMNMKISEICEQVGYLNPEHFSRVFKKATGYSPRAYRGKFRENSINNINLLLK